MSGAIVKDKQDVAANVERALVATMPKLSELLPSHVLKNKDVFLRITATAMKLNPDLAECSALSIVLSVAQACSIGLVPNTPLGLGYLVPFAKTCQFIVGYKGLIRLATQSGEVAKIDARPVFAQDHLDLAYGLVERLEHVPKEGDRTEQSMVGVYAIATLTNGEKKFEYLTKKEVDAIRARAKAGTKGPWVTDYIEMARKTAIRRLCKTLPLSEESLQHKSLGRALQIQGQNEVGDDMLGDLMPEFADEAPSTPVKGSLAEKAGT